MNMPGIERSRVDDRWCVYSKHFEGLCPLWAIPILLVMAVFARPSKMLASQEELMRHLSQHAPEGVNRFTGEPLPPDNRVQ